MKKLLLLLTLFVAHAATWAQNQQDEQTELVSGSKYRIVSLHDNGVIVLGTYHNSSAQLFSDVTDYSASWGTTETYPEDAWWIITKGENGYTFKNDKSGQYIQYDPVRVDAEKKGLSMGDASDTEEQLWDIVATQNEGVFNVKSLYATTHYFNLRTDGSHLLGTYESSYHGTNESFLLFDEAGNQVLSVPGSGGDGGNGGGNGGEGGGNSGGGVTNTTALEDLVIVSAPTDADALAYPIQNLRSKGYAIHDENNSMRLGQTYLATYAAQWIFVEAGGQMGSKFQVKLYNVARGMYLADVEPVGYSESYDKATSWYISPLSDSYGDGYKISRSYIDFGQEVWNDYGGEGHEICYWSSGDGSVWVFGEGQTPGEIPDGPDTPDPNPPLTGNFSDYVDSLTINGMSLVFDTYYNQYMYALPTTVMESGDFTAEFDFLPKNGATSISIVLDETEMGTDSTVVMTGIDGTESHTIAIKRDGVEVASAAIAFTFLPIVEVNVPTCNGSYYTQGTLAVHDPDNWTEGADSVYYAKFKWRGATAMGKSKKAYAVKIIDANGNKLDAKFLDLRNDNNWILDAAAVDPSCMRNRVSTDLWNDFANKPYYADREKKARTGTRGGFVEVIYNGAYMGVYCMTEKMDRKQMKLKKTDPADPTLGTAETLHGGLYKTSQWSYEVLMGHEQGSAYYPMTEPDRYSNYSETWAEHEVKYPDLGDGETIDWKPMWDAVNFVATTSDSDFDYLFDKYFNLSTLNDYYLFIELLLATDNHGKNMFWGVYDMADTQEGKKMELGVWDLDGTWGRNWAGSSSYTPATEPDYMQFLWDHEHGASYLFLRTMTSRFRNNAALLEQRYAELRPTYFEPEALVKRFTDYGDLFATSGADARESSRWPGYHPDIPGEMDYVSEWIRARVETLDALYNFDPIATGIDRYTGQTNVIVKGGRGSIIIFSATPKVVDIVAVNGQIIRQVNVDGTLVTESGFAPGIYVVEGKKIIVK